LITTEHLTFDTDRSDLSAPRLAGRPAPAAPEDTEDLRFIEKAMIERALIDAKHNKSMAARKLGLTRKQLYVRLRQHGLT
jgi:DNA-binding NtrC family response regulator